MQILIPDSWLRDYLDTNATPKQIQHALSLCGPSIERLYEKEGDYVYDIEVTTNRVDMMSVTGIAFECLAILPRFGYTAKLKRDPYKEKLSLTTYPHVEYLKVTLDKSLCDRFSAVLIRNVTVDKSPDFIVKRLELAGQRSLNNVVDISNYLMLEMGQPVHTFDYDKISGAHMTLRKSRSGEQITTLDGKSHILPGDDIVIEDGSKKIIDLCGIMGGANSAVDLHTKNVLLFVQVYEPTAIRKTSMKLAHRTNAAVLFEKGLSVENVLPTLNLGLQLFKHFTKGVPEAKVLDVLNIKPQTSVIKLQTSLTELISTRLGVNLSFSEIKKILQSLEFDVVSEKEIGVSWIRSKDVLLPEDLVEEVARIYGYHNIPSKIMSGDLPTLRPNEQEFHWISEIKSALKYWGYTETYTYSLVPHDTGLSLKNYLTEDWKFLRTTLSPSLKAVVTENFGRVSEINIFEIANVYLPQKEDLPKEVLHLAIATSKPNGLPHLMGVIDNLQKDLGCKIHSVVTTKANFTCVEIDLSSVYTSATKIKQFQPISKFAPIIEDINVTHTGSYKELESRIYKTSPLIQSVEFIEKYGDKLTLRLTFLDQTRQLTKEDIAPIREKLG